jgi:flagellar basal body-associated protein FliL
MSEETQETNDGTWSGLKKTIIGTLTTVIAGGGVWVSTLLFGGGDEPAEETKTEQVAPAGQPVIVNVQQNQENKQKVENGGGTHVIERVVEKPATTQPQPEKPKKVEEESW